MKPIRVHYGNLAKHGVQPEEVLNCLARPSTIRTRVRKRVPRIYRVIGQTSGGRFLEVMYEDRIDDLFVFHAMDARPNQIRLFRRRSEELEAAGYLEEPSQREKKELEASATLALLQMSGLHLKLTRKEYEKLVELATQVDVPVETLAKKWIRAKLRAPAEHQANSKR